MITQPTDAGTIRAQLEELHRESFAWALVCAAHEHSEAEDVLQMTYLKILDGRASYAGRSAFKTWLFGVIRMTAREHRRRALWRWLRRAPIEEAADRPAPQPPPDEAAGRGETGARGRGGGRLFPRRPRRV